MRNIYKRIKKQKEVVGLYRKIFKTEDGQKVLADLMSLCGMSRSSFSTDATEMAFNEGQRSVVLRILKTVNISEAELQKWFEMNEAQAKELEEQEELI